MTLPRVPHTNIRYLGEICICFLLNITIFEGYLVLNVGKLWSYISFLVKPPTSFILYCVYPSIWSLYTVTLSPRIASAIQTKHKKSKMIFTVSQNQTLCSIQMPKRFLIFNNKNSLLCTTEEGVLIFLVEKRDNKMLYFLAETYLQRCQLPRIGMPATFQRHWTSNSIWISANKRIRKIRTFLPTFYWQIYQWPWKTSCD